MTIKKIVIYLCLLMFFLGSFHIKNAKAQTVDNVIDYTGTVSTSQSNAFCYTEFWSGSYVVQSGDTLVYDEYVTGPEYMSGIGGYFSDGTDLRSTGLTDQNGIGIHPNNNTYPYSASHWYNRTFSLTSLAGKTLQYLDIVFEGDDAGSYETYFKNIYIKNSVGSIVEDVYDGTQTYSGLSYCGAANGGGYGYSAVSSTEVPDPTLSYFNAAYSITSGPLSVGAPNFDVNFPKVTLDGIPQNVDGTLSNWSIQDATGTQDGWNVEVSASTMTEVTPTGGFASGTNALTFPAGSLSLVGSRQVELQTGAQALNTTGGPLFVNEDGILDSGTPIVLVKADVGYGSGDYTIVEPSNGIQLTVPADQQIIDPTNYPTSPTPYSDSIVYTISSGP